MRGREEGRKEEEKEEMEEEREGGIYFGPQSKGIVHHCGKAMTAVAGGF